VGTGRMCCGAARGTTNRTTYALPTAIGTIPTIETRTTGFGVWVRPRLYLSGRKQPQVYGPAARAWQAAAIRRQRPAAMGGFSFVSRMRTCYTCA
jgi:hypothetical protein